MTGRRVSPGREGYLTSADAFLLSGAVVGLAFGVMEFAFREASVWSELLSQVAIIGSVIAGTALAWRLHGHGFDRATWLGLLLSTLVGGLLLIPAFFAVFSLGRFIPSPVPDVEGPWGSVLLLAVIVVGFLVMPVWWAVKDLATRRNLRMASVRMGALSIVVAAVVITTAIGGETAETGIFMVPVAAASAAAVAAYSWFRSRRKA